MARQFDNRMIPSPVVNLRPQIVRRLLHFDASYYVDMLGAFSQYLDQLLVVLFLAPASLGIYAVAVSASRILNVIPTSVSTVLFPTVLAAIRLPDRLELVWISAGHDDHHCRRSLIVLSILGPFLLHVLDVR